MKLLFIILMTLAQAIYASPLLDEAQNFHKWMTKYQNDFAKCSPIKTNSETYQLCDKTLISRSELKTLFSLKPQELVAKIKSKGVYIEIFCHSGASKVNFKNCKENKSWPGFKKNKALQGQFKPLQNTILLRSHANRGSLIHEYIHYLQYTNKNKVYGREYKRSRVAVESKLIKAMDKIIVTVKKLEKKKVTKSKIMPYLTEMIALSNEMRAFSKWQDIIDERNIFLLFLNFGYEFGIKKEDVLLARKNMGFICNRKDIKSLFRKAECSKFTVSTGEFKAAIIEIIKEIRPQKNIDSGIKNIETYLKNLSKMPTGSLEKKVRVISDYIFKTLRLRADTNFTSIDDADNILVDSILTKKRAHCVGLSSLYLLAAEKWKLTPHFVRIPDHVFPRICEKEKCLNIETLKNGLIVTDDYYFKNAYATKKQIEGTTYLKNLSTGKKLKSSLYLSLGYIAQNTKEYGLAEYFYKKSIDSDRSFSEGYLNLASTYAALGNKIQARAYLSVAGKINPNHIPTLINQSITQWNQGHKKKALLSLQKAQKINQFYVLIYQTRAKFMHDSKNVQKEFENLLMVSNIRPSDCKGHAQILKLKSSVDTSKLKKEILFVENAYKKECS